MRPAQIDDLYNVPSVSFTLTGSEASILFTLINGELRKSNSIAETALRYMLDKLTRSATAALIAKPLPAMADRDVDGLQVTPEAKALLVVALTPHIRLYLAQTDPKALEQVDNALGLEVK